MYYYYLQSMIFILSLEQYFKQNYLSLYTHDID